MDGEVTTTGSGEQDPSAAANARPPRRAVGAVARASGIMMAALLMSRVLGQLRDTVIAAQFGMNAATDVYRSAFAIPDLLFFLIAGGALSSAFIPVFSDYLSKGEDSEAWRVFSVVATVMAIVVTVAVLVCEVFAVPLTRMLRPDWDARMIAETAFLTRIVLPSQIAFFLGGLMFSTLYTREHFLTPAMGPNIYNLGIIVVGLLLARYAGAGLGGYAVGALVGAVIGNLLMPMFTLSRLGIHYRFDLDVRHPGVRKVWRLMLPVILGLSLPGLYGLINGFFASYLADGSISALDQANRLMQAPLGIFGQALAIAVFPTLSMLAAQRDFGAYRQTLGRALRNVIFLTIPVSTAMAVFALDVVRVLFQYGRFRPDDSALTAIALVYYCVGIFAWSSLAIVQRAFYALQDTRTPILMGTVATVLFIPLSGLLASLMGHSGLALATSVGAVGQMLWMLRALHLRVDGIDARGLTRSAGRVVLASGLMAAACLATRAPIAHLGSAYGLDSRLLSLFTIVFSGGLGAMVFIATASALKMDELNSARSLLFRRGKPVA